jgi:hypothetical protein
MAFFYRRLFLLSSSEDSSCSDLWVSRKFSGGACVCSVNSNDIVLLCVPMLYVVPAHMQELAKPTSVSVTLNPRCSRSSG